MRGNLLAVGLAACLWIPIAATLPSDAPPKATESPQTPPQKPGDNRSSHSSGVITPPNVDPGMATKPPAVGSAIVLPHPPPANQKPQPK
jgi:hypothetical protein